MSTKRKIDQILNIVGLLQPQSNFLVCKTLEKVEEGTTLEVISSENNPRDIIAHLRPKGKYKITETKVVHGFFHHTIVKGKGAPLLRE